MDELLELYKKKIDDLEEVKRKAEIQFDKTGSKKMEKLIIDMTTQIGIMYEKYRSFKDER